MAKQGDLISNSGYPTNQQPARKKSSGSSPTKVAKAFPKSAKSVKPLPGTK